jgi:hypothetical protein
LKHLALSFIADDAIPDAIGNLGFRWTNYGLKNVVKLSMKIIPRDHYFADMTGVIALWLGRVPKDFSGNIYGTDR